MQIIFEGLDNTGKSTQIDNIRKYYNNKGFIVTHSNFIHGLDKKDYKNIAIKEYSQMFEIYNKFPEIDIISDRLHLGEYVYSPLYRDYDGSHIFNLEKKYNLDKLNVFLFVFIADIDTLLKRDDGLSFSTEIDKKQYEIDAFTKAFEKSIIKNKLLIDTSKMSIDETHQNIINFIKEHDTKHAKS